MASTSRAYPALLALVGVALAAGAGAALLTGATPQPAPTTGPPLVELPSWFWGILFLSPFVLGFVAYILQRGRSTAGRRDVVRILGPFLGALVFFLLFIAATHVVSSGGCLFYCYASGTVAGANNSSANGTHNTTPGNFTVPSAPPLSLSNVLPIVIIVAASLVVAAVAIPALLSRAARRDQGREGQDTGAREAREALAAAASALDEGHDPRLVIVRLYNRLLLRVTPLGAGVEFATAEEIRTTQLLPLGVRKAAADTLTRLFEEARYSTHPMGAAAVAQARDAIRAAEADLGRFEAAP